MKQKYPKLLTVKGKFGNMIEILQISKYTFQSSTDPKWIDTEWRKRLTK